jgi:hypothetical protein
VPPRCMPGWDVSIKLFPQLGNYPPVRESSWHVMKCLYNKWICKHAVFVLVHVRAFKIKTGCCLLYYRLGKGSLV